MKSEITREAENQYRRGLEKSLQSGLDILQNGGSSLDAVEASVVVLEDDPLFNAGKGSVFTHHEKNEMDASIMCGKTLEAGAVAFVQNVKNPIKLSRLIMEMTEHILLAGRGASEFAREMDVKFAADEYFFTDHRYKQLLRARERGLVQLDHSTNDDRKSKSQAANRKSKFGTVGAVACDKNGNLAAATSTGGMTNKNFSRIGDTPIIGSGTYAENATCAVSCTGHGEYFMKAVSAFDLSARMKYKNLSLEEAANEVIEYQTKIDGEGGLIAVDRFGNVALPFNSEGMYRGWIDQNGEINLGIYK